MEEQEKYKAVEKQAQAAAANIHLEYMRTDAADLTLRDALIKAYKQGRLDEKSVPDLSLLQKAFNAGKEWGVTYYTWFTPTDEDHKKRFNDFVNAERTELKRSKNPITLLDEMIEKENEALGKVGFYNQYERETHANNKYCLAIVKSLIEARLKELKESNT